MPKLSLIVDVNVFAGSVGATNMNMHSSRSHAIFTVTVECSEKGADGEQHVRVGKLHLVDLAVSNNYCGIFFDQQRERSELCLVWCKMHRSVGEGLSIGKLGLWSLVFRDEIPLETA